MSTSRAQAEQLLRLFQDCGNIMAALHLSSSHNLHPTAPRLPTELETQN